MPFELERLHDMPATRRSEDSKNHVQEDLKDSPEE
jgi:hypothetical protein